MNKLDKLTVLIVTFQTNKEILFRCIDSIQKKIKILIIENSSDSDFKEQIEKKYDNVEVVLSHKNLGYGAGNNLGLKKINTRYVLISNPDVVYNNDFFKNLNIYLETKIDFSMLGASYNDQRHFASAGYFDKKAIKKDFNNEGLKEVDWIMGCTMVIDKKNIKTNSYFDENFFMFWEEFDLCKRSKSNNGKIFCSSKLLIDHLGNMGSFAHDPEKFILAEKFRNWHITWSEFYFKKKHYSYFFAITNMSGKFFRSLFKLVYFTFLNNKIKKTIYGARLSGTFNSMIGKKSWFRVKFSSKKNPNDQEI